MFKDIKDDHAIFNLIIASIPTNNSKITIPSALIFAGNAYSPLFKIYQSSGAKYNGVPLKALMHLKITNNIKLNALIFTYLNFLKSFPSPS